MPPSRLPSYWLLGASLITLIPTLPATATTYRVPSQTATIQAAIDLCAAGDTVLLAAGTYTGEGNRDLFTHGRDFVLLSEGGAEVTTFDLQGSPQSPHSCISFYDGATRATVVNGLTIRNGWHDHGAMACGGSSPTIEDCRFLNNVSNYHLNSGGINCSGDGTPLFRGCLFSGNGGYSGGVSADMSSAPEIEDCAFVENEGSGVMSSGHAALTIRSCVFRGNNGYGAGGNIETGDMVIEDSEFSRNSAGAIFSGGSAIQIRRCTFASNLSGYGGAIYAGGSHTTIENSLFWHNCAHIGSDIYAYGALRLVCCAYADSGIVLAGHGHLEEVGPQVHSDPQFCDQWPCPPDLTHEAGGDYALRSDSPCLAEFSPCGQQIGVWGQNCIAPAPVGACCFGADDCRLLTAQDCETQQGNYLGDGVSCYPSPCVPTAVRVTTWGQIKARFRDASK